MRTRRGFSASDGDPVMEAILSWPAALGDSGW
jgi:hypothetical protein